MVSQTRSEGFGSEALDVAIIGAGLSGLCLAIRLRQAGISRFALFEKAEGIGGTWRDNTYPGAACDVPSHLYSFSFARKRDWSRKYAAQQEILEYIDGIARRYDLVSHLRLGVELAAARFDRSAGLWRITTRRGETIAAKALVSGCGQLNRPHIPDLPGRSDFAGVQFHSARWDHGFDPAGKSIAVIGNGASAVQLIPEIARRAGKLYVFQRSANWIIARGDRAYGKLAQWLFRRAPLVERLYRYLIYWSLEMKFVAFAQGAIFGKLAERMALNHLDHQIADPRLRAILRPDYPIGCKRILISDDYYPALLRSNVELVTAPLAKVTRDAVVTADGAERRVDAIIYATGFESTDFLAPLDLAGDDGVPMAQRWRRGAEAHLGMTVPGYPNFFMMYGPNTNLGHNSIVFMIECQARYIARCLSLLFGGKRIFEVTPQAMARSQARLEAALARTVWAAGCRSWYKTAEGRITNNWSGLTAEYWWRTRRPDFREYTAT